MHDQNDNIEIIAIQPKSNSGIDIQTLLICFFIVMLLPFIILNYFNNPTPEDFVFGLETKRLGFLKAQEFFNQIWSGRYFSYAVLSINSIILKFISGYKISTLLFMLLFFYTIFLFVSEVTFKILLFAERLVFSLSIVFLYLYSAPSISQGFYWLTAVAIYHLSVILILFFCICFIRLKRTNSTVLKRIYTFISCLIIMFISGTSEIGAAFFLILIGILITKSIFVDKKIDKSLVLFFIVTLISMYFTFTSQGNFNRTTNHFPDSHNLSFSISNSFIFLKEEFIPWIFYSPILVITLLLIPLFYKILDDNENINSNWFSINPLFSLTALFIFPITGNFIIAWTTGILFYGRAMNITYITFLIIWFYNVVVLLSYIKNKYNRSIRYFPDYVNKLLLLIVFLFLLKINNINIAFGEIVTGVAANYNNQMNGRYITIEQNNSDSCKVNKIVNVPKMFILYDITEDPENIYNKWYKQFFNKKSIIVTKTSP